MIKISAKNKNLVLRTISDSGPISREILADSLNLSQGYIGLAVRLIRLDLGEDTIITTASGYKVPNLPEDQEEVDLWWRLRMKNASTGLSVSKSVIWTCANKTSNNRLFVAVDDINHAKRIVDYQLGVGVQ